MTGETEPPFATFEAVADHVDTWRPERATGRGLREYLNARLNEGVENVWERDVVEGEPGSSRVEVVVNGEIAVAFAEPVGPSTVPELRRSLSALADRYNYLVVYWRDPNEEHRGYRRSVERSTSARRLGTRGLRFVTPPAEAAASGDSFPSPPWSVVAVGLVLFCAVPASLWLVVQTTGFARLLLLSAAGLFTGTLMFGAFVAH